jgi:hypothetical protein
VCKVRIIQEPKKVALWNKWHFEEKNRECAACLKYSVLIFVEKIYIKCNIWRVAVRPSYIEDARLLKIKNCGVINMLDVHGSVHHSKIHTEKSNKKQQCIKIYYSIFIWSSTRFGRHTTHHQEPKTALAASGFAYAKGCWTLRLLDTVSIQQPQCSTSFHVRKIRGC